MAQVRDPQRLSDLLEIKNNLNNLVKQAFSN